jgi:hypothetical protein
LTPVLGLTFHEYISHEYFKPKNILLECSLLTVFVTYTWDSLRNKKNYHFLHHKYVGDPLRDPTQAKLDNTSISQYIFEYGKQTHIPIPIETANEFNSKVWVFFDTYHVYILILTMIIWMMAFPIWTVFAFYFYPKLLLNLTTKSVDIYFHKYNGHDLPLLTFFFGSSCLHISHHKTWRVNYCGDGVSKILNLQYWYGKLLFKTG